MRLASSPTMNHQRLSLRCFRSQWTLRQSETSYTGAGVTVVARKLLQYLPRKEASPRAALPVTAAKQSPPLLSSGLATAKAARGKATARYCILKLVYMKRVTKVSALICIWIARERTIENSIKELYGHADKDEEKGCCGTLPTYENGQGRFPCPSDVRLVCLSKRRSDCF